MPKIMIDAGHGGTDSGAVGLGNTKEKDINLKNSYLLKSLFEQSGYEVALTRKGDEYVSLADRVSLANASGADTFISLHVNASVDRSANGVETYVYAFGGEAEKIAKNVQSKLANVGMFRDRGVKTANFYVIKNTKMPAILIELGFISNPDEEALLNNDEVLQKHMNAVFEGYQNYKGVVSSMSTISKDYAGHWAEETIEKMMEKGVFVKGNTFRPDEAVTRGELAAVAERLLNIK